MGVELSKIDYQNKHQYKRRSRGMNNFLSNIEFSIVDQAKVGDVFLLVMKDKTGVRQIAHHAVLIDVAGASNDTWLKGVLLHLTANPVTRRCKFRFGDEPRRRDAFYEIVEIGQVIPPNNIHPTMSKQWACSLVADGDYLFNQLTSNGTKRTWSSSTNCQIFCKSFLAHFGFRWPADLPFIDDEVIPLAVDVSIGLISTSARKYCKKNGHPLSDTTDEE